MKATRVFQITALLLVIVSVIQVGWWILDLHHYSTQRLRDERATYAREVMAAQTLLDAGTSVERVRALLPDVALTGRQAQADPAVEAGFVDERYRRINQYAWESGFFLLVLALCIAVIWRALRAANRARVSRCDFASPLQSASYSRISCMARRVF